MIYFFTCISALLFMLWSYYFVKTYQLCGYKIHPFCLAFIKLDLAFGDKNRLVFTKRVIRFCILLFAVAFGLFFLNYYFISSVPLCILNSLAIIILLPLFMIVCHYLLLPIEELIKHCYIIKAKKKLAKKKIIKVAITGSYGKTSTKNILVAMLEKEYKVCTTPKNYNTEMGLTKTILSSLDDHDVLVAEFGARRKGDIEKLTKILNPDYGILTTIGCQHLESFKSLENIEETKNELVVFMRTGGTMVFSGDSKSTKKLYDSCKRQKFLACSEKGYAKAKNVELTEKGSRFDLILDGEKLKVETKLLGQCNINNITTAAAMASILGISNKDIASAIRQLEPTPHRLQLIKNDSVTVIDDAYNSNLIGAKEALNVMSKFVGTKIVVTPGFVEMGSEQSQANFTLGGMIADVADFIIIMNDVNKNELLSGAISHNFKLDKIYFATTRKRQKELLELLTTKNSIILFENDLPDNYK